MTTKEQERKALAQIRKIVEGLGSGSYIGMAFEGCFEIAEENIENDFGCSMKQKWEAAEQKYQAAAQERDDAQAAAVAAQSEVEQLKGKVLTTAEAGAIKNILYHAQMDAAALADSAAQRIVEAAEEPESSEFRQAVQDNRAGKKRMEDCKTLIQRPLETMR